MGRPGVGGGGSSGSSGGHHSSRKSDGHRVGGGRPMGSSSSSGGYPHSSLNSRGGYHYNPIFIRSGGYYGGLQNPLGTLLFVIIAIIMLTQLIPSHLTSNPKSTYNRERLKSSIAFTNNCIVDEIGWIEKPSQLSKGLQYFYKQTGVQPYIVLKKYDPKLKTDSDKEAYANQYYDKNIKNESTFLYMYFEEPNSSDVGYMAYANGMQVSSVMDEEAIDIFWQYLDRYWVDGNLSMNQVFEKTFTKTADTIMTKSTTGLDIVKIVVVSILIISAGIVVIILVRQKHKRDKEKAEETERILNTPLKDYLNS